MVDPAVQSTRVRALANNAKGLTLDTNATLCVQSILQGGVDSLASAPPAPAVAASAARVLRATRDTLSSELRRLLVGQAYCAVAANGPVVPPGGGGGPTPGALNFVDVYGGIGPAPLVAVTGLVSISQVFIIPNSPVVPPFPKVFWSNGILVLEAPGAGEPTAPWSVSPQTITFAGGIVTIFDGPPFSPNMAGVVYNALYFA